MKINETTSLSSPQILLVPYSAHHVPTYHKWMQNPDLQAATASEPLSMEQEYAMQQSWRTDRDKLTFILCFPLSKNQKSISTVNVGVDDAPEKMVGDINLFLFDDDDEDNEQKRPRNGGARNVVGEIELMIARKGLWRKGYGRAALLVFLRYIVREWEGIGEEFMAGESTPRLAYLRVKINQENVGSIALFDKVGFVRTAEGPNYFGEVELRWRPDAGALSSEGYQILGYSDRARDRCASSVHSAA